jgi:Peptidase family M23
MMAAGGTPLLAVADGIVSNKVNDPSEAGLAMSITDRLGNRYFYAHLSAYASGISIGKHVKMGDIIGFVGNTGNAAGGASHLHFEVRPFGGAAVPPKPYVDRWLDSAEQEALQFVRRVTGKRVDLKNLDYSLWKNKLLELAQDEIQAANLLTAREAAAAARAKRKASPGVDQQTVPYALPVLLLALLGAGLLFKDTRWPGRPSRKSGEPDDVEVIPLPEALELAILNDMEAAFAEVEATPEEESAAALRV